MNFKKLIDDKSFSAAHDNRARMVITIEDALDLCKLSKLFGIHHALSMDYLRNPTPDAKRAIDSLLNHIADDMGIDVKRLIQPIHSVIKTIPMSGNGLVQDDEEDISIPAVTKKIMKSESEQNTSLARVDELTSFNTKTNYDLNYIKNPIISYKGEAEAYQANQDRMAVKYWNKTIVYFNGLTVGESVNLHSYFTLFVGKTIKYAYKHRYNLISWGYIEKLDNDRKEIRVLKQIPLGLCLDGVVREVNQAFDGEHTDEEATLEQKKVITLQDARTRNLKPLNENSSGLKSPSDKIKQFPVFVDALREYPLGESFDIKEFKNRLNLSSADQYLALFVRCGYLETVRYGVKKIVKHIPADISTSQMQAWVRDHPLTSYKD